MADQTENNYVKITKMFEKDATTFWKYRESVQGGNKDKNDKIMELIYKYKSKYK